MFGLGPTEFIIIAIIIFLIFGAKRLPEIGKGLGGAIRELRNIKKELRPKDSPEDGADKNRKSEKDIPPALEDKAVNKVLEQVPGAKKAVDIKKKAEKIKEIIK